MGMKMVMLRMVRIGGTSDGRSDGTTDMTGNGLVEGSGDGASSGTEGSVLEGTCGSCSAGTSHCLEGASGSMPRKGTWGNPLIGVQCPQSYDEIP